MNRLRRGELCSFSFFLCRLHKMTLGLQYIIFLFRRLQWGRESGHVMTEVRNLEAGEKSPSFTAIDSDGNNWSSDDLASEGKSIILYFYPKDSTPGCTTQACDFRDNMNRLSDEGYVVLGVSKDTGKSHGKFIQNQNLNFPLLMDEDLTIHHAFGAWREKQNYGRKYMGCSRSTFVIDSNGILSFARYNVKAKGHVEMLMRELSING